MADEEKEPEEEATASEEDGAKGGGKKKTIFLGGGIIGLIAFAYCAFLMAVPSVEEKPEVAGPFVSELLAAPLSVNLSGNDNRDYLAMNMRAEYGAYEEAYVATRTADPLYEAMITDKIMMVVSGKNKKELDGTAGKEILREELRSSVDPILFPVHIGNLDSSSASDPMSGLRPGISAPSATMRGLFHDHFLHVDEPDKTIALDGGDEFSFTGTEDNLRVVDAQGDTLYIDVTSVTKGFVGEVNVGVLGRIRSMYFSHFITQ